MTKPNLTLRVFMQHLQQSLKKKTGQPQNALARKVYGQVKAFSTENPQLLGELSTQIDMLPNPITAERIFILIRCRRDELLSEHRADLAGRAHRRAEPVYLDEQF